MTSMKSQDAGGGGWWWRTYRTHTVVTDSQDTVRKIQSSCETVLGEIESCDRDSHLSENALFLK